MRKNKFLLNLIAATALSLSVIGCGSSSSGAIASTADITAAASNNAFAERLKLHEYFILGQRGINTFAPSFAAGQSAPTNAVATIAGSGDGVIDAARALLFEIDGIAQIPLPNANIQGPGPAGSTPTSPTVATGASGFHSVEVDPAGDYVIMMSRGRDRGATADDRIQVTQNQLQISRLAFAQPIDVQFPPSIIFQTVAATNDTIIFSPDATHPLSQGKFVSGVWGPAGNEFYASINGSVFVLRLTRNIGQLDLVQTNTFPAGAANTNNNAVKMIVSRDGKFLYALDNTNNNIVRWDRSLVDGTLSNVTNIPTVADPRGFAVDRTGQFMYVAGRSSALLAAYRIGADGSLTPLEVFAGSTAVPVALPGAPPLGDVAFNPQSDQLFVATYAGVLQGYNLNTTNGSLTVSGSSDDLLSLSRNTTNIEVEPTGRFVITVQENDLEEFQTFITTGPYVENPIFANIDSATNTGAGVYSATPMQDANGRTVFALPAALGQEFKGDVQVFRINADGSVQANSRGTAADNPYGLSFFTRVITPPASTT